VTAALLGSTPQGLNGKPPAGDRLLCCQLLSCRTASVQVGTLKDLNVTSHPANLFKAHAKSLIASLERSSLSLCLLCKEFLTVKAVDYLEGEFKVICDNPAKF
jgi:hypothetical protein